MFKTGTGTKFIRLTSMSGWIIWITFQWLWSIAFGDVRCSIQDYGEFISDPKSCENFYYCDNSGRPMQVYCPEGMWFNPKKRICDLPTNVKCVLEDDIHMVDDEDIRCPITDTSFVTFAASRVSCSRFYLCYHGQPFKQECIAELHWNPQKNRCDFPSKAKCTTQAIPPRCPARGQVLRPHPTECDYFYYCINGFASLQQCPFYHHWDVETMSCQWKNRARCINDQDTMRYKSRPKGGKKHI